MKQHYKNITKILQKYNIFYWLFLWNIIFYVINKNINKDGGITLAIGDIIVGIDIGTSKVSLVVGEVNNFNQIEVIYTNATE